VWQDVIVLEPHALKCSVLFHIFPAPSKCAGVRVANSVSNRLINYWNSAKPTEKSVALLHLKPRFQTGIALPWSNVLSEDWWHVWYRPETVNLLASTAPNRLCPHGDDGHVGLANQNLSARVLAREIGIHGLPKQARSGPNFRDGFEQALPWR